RSYSQTKDKDLLAAFDKAIDATMKEIESNMQARVRIGGKSEDRTTGNLVYGTFTHEESRPVNGIPDPHLHQHVFVFNATYDKKEEKWKAGQFGNIKADGQYYETVFNSRLANELSKVGYNIERTKNDFELVGFERSTIEKFSNRTKQVEQAALEMGLTSDKQKDQIGAKTRANKRSGLDRDILQAEWKARLSEKELALVFAAKGGSNNTDGNSRNENQITPDKALEYAIEHSLERKSVVGKKELMIHALKRSYGDATPQQINQSIQEREDLISKITSNGSVYTTKEALLEEKQLIQTTRSGKGILEAVNPTYEIQNPLLNKEQQRAVHHALRSKDFVTAITGGAGTGKTWSIKEVAEGAKESNTPFLAFAPSASASRGVQRADGFENATTIAELLQSKKLQEQTKNGIIWIDESGMVGNKTMNQVFAVAKEQNARVLLTGDIKQHGAVERGDAMRIMQKYGGLEPAYISKIQRQQVAHYKSAIRQLSEGNMEKGY
ncbi:MAG: MobF family relaxase, partial [Bacteroidota bacterium]